MIFHTAKHTSGRCRVGKLSGLALGFVLFLLARPELVLAQSGPGWVNAPLKQGGTAVVPFNSVKSKVTTSTFRTALNFQSTSSAAPQTASMVLAPYTAPESAPDYVTPEITDLAVNLQNQPLLIFNWVRNHIDYVHYYGCKKGAALTLIEGSGNDADQCALLVALLRAAGHQAKYVFGWTYIPYSNPYGVGLKDLLQVDEGILGGFMATRGTPSGQFGSTNNLYYGSVLYGWNRYWVEMDGTSWLDPTIKQYAKIPGQNVGSLSGYDRNNLLTAAAGTVSGAGVNGINESALGTYLAARTTQFLSSCRSQFPNVMPAEIMSGYCLVQQDASAVSQNFFGLQLGAQTSFTFPGPYYGSTDPAIDILPNALCSTLRLRIGSTLDVTLKTSQLRGRKLTLTFESNQAVLRLDDASTPLAQEVGGSGTTAGLYMTMSHAGGVGNQSDINPVTYSRSGSYVLLYGFDVSDRWVRDRQVKLETYRRTLADTSREVKTETLNVMGLIWFRQTHLQRLMFAALSDDSFTWAHRFGRMADEFNGTSGGYYVDVPYDYALLVPRLFSRWNNAPYYNDIIAGTLVASAMEHGILEQLQSTAANPVQASSTVKLLSVANAMPTGQNVVFLVDSANWTAGANIRSQLSKYSASDLTALDAMITSGAQILLPKIGSLAVQSWHGSGYMSVLNNSTSLGVGMIIGGGYNGGYGGNQSTITIDPPTYYFRTNPSTISSTPVTVATTGSREPIDLATGQYYCDSTDLVLGNGALPRGLTLARHYSGQTRFINSAALGYGWNHSLNIRANDRTDTEAAMGQTTLQDMASMLITCYAALDVYKNRSTVKDWTVAALIANWGVNGLKNNSVALALADKVIQFHAQPDGTYTPPAGVTMSLTKTAGKYTAQERFGNTYAFDTDGTLLTVSDLWNRSASFTYESHTLNNAATKLPKVVTDCYQRKFTFNYTGDMLTSVTETAGATRSVNFTQDANTDLVTFTDPESKTNTYAYSAHRIALFKDHTGRVIAENLYDSKDRVYQQNAYGDSVNKAWQYYYAPGVTIEDNPKSGLTTYLFDSRNRRIGVVDALGKKFTTGYDGQDHAVSQTTALGYLTSATYDLNQNIKTSTDALGNVTQYFYDASLHLVEVRDPLNHSTFYSNFNAYHQPQTITDAEGRVLTRTYFTAGNGAGMVQTTSAAGQQKAAFAYDAFGNVNTVTYPNGQSESSIFNARGDLISTTNARNFTTSLTYNARREVLTSTGPGSLSTDPAVVTRQDYDDYRNVASTTNPRGFITRMTYSAQGKLLTTTLPMGQTVTNSYDSRDWLVSTTDPLLHQVIFTYDDTGRRTKVKDPLTNESEVTYDDDGRPQFSYDPLRHSTQSVLDARGSLRYTIDYPNPNAARTIQRQYDDAGRMTTLINRNNQTWTFGFDKTNKPTTTQSPLGKQIKQEYDTQGRLWKSTQPSGNYATLGFDARDRVTTRTFYKNGGALQATVAYTPDANGNVLTVTEGTKVLSRTFDQQDRVKSYQNAAGETIGYRYDASGNLRTLTYPDGKVVTYDYDNNDRLTTIIDWASRVTRFYYDDTVHLTRVKRPNGTWRQLVYDNADRLVRVDERLSDGRLVTHQKYGYDAASRLTTKFTVPKMHPASLATFSGTYNADNQTNGLAHDADGNMLAFPNVPAANTAFTQLNHTATWDTRNRLVSLQSGVGFQPAFSATYTYDSEGNRTSKTVNSQTTTWTVNPHGISKLSEVLVETAPGGAKKFFVYGPTGLLYDVDSATTPNVRYYHADQVGSTVALTDASATVIGRAEYSAYGMVSYREGDTATPFLYNGAYGVMTDAESGLLNMRARYYHPWMGRFVSEDPIGFEGGMNWYGYVGGNPISVTDPQGTSFPGAHLDNFVKAGADMTAAYQGYDAASGIGKNYDELGYNAWDLKQQYSFQAATLLRGYEEVLGRGDKAAAATYSQMIDHNLTIAGANPSILKSPITYAAMGGSGGTSFEVTGGKTTSLSGARGFGTAGPSILAGMQVFSGGQSPPNGSVSVQSSGNIAFFGFGIGYNAAWHPATGLSVDVIAGLGASKGAFLGLGTSVSESRSDYVSYGGGLTAPTAYRASTCSRY